VENGVIRGRERLISLVLAGLLVLMDELVGLWSMQSKQTIFGPPPLTLTWGSRPQRKLSPGLPELV
jgi:hypothetical protein